MSSYFIQKHSPNRNIFFLLHCLPGVKWRHGGNMWDWRCGRDGNGRRTSTATVPLSAWWEESGVCPDGVQPAQWEPHRIHNHWAGRSTTWPKVLTPLRPSESVFSDVVFPNTATLFADIHFPSGKQLISYFWSICPQYCSQLTKTQ